MISKEKLEKATDALFYDVFLSDFKKSLNDAIKNNDLSKKEVLYLIGLPETYKPEDITVYNLCKLSLLSKFTHKICPDGYDILEDSRKKLLYDFISEQQKKYEQFVKDNNLEDIAFPGFFSEEYTNQAQDKTGDKVDETCKDNAKNTSNSKNTRISAFYEDNNGNVNYCLSINGKKYKIKSYDDLLKIINDYPF